MAEERDFNEVLDDIVLTEERVYKESYEEGFRASSEAKNPEGFHLGYHRGAELGLELGFYLGTVNHYLALNDITPQYTEKIISQLSKVKELIDAFPRTNSEDHDILALAENIRAQYKKTCALLKISSTLPFEHGVSF